MEKAAVLRQLIGEIQELCDLYAWPPPPSSSSPPPPFLQHYYQRCLFLNLNNSSLEDSFFNLITEGKLKNMKMIDANKSPPAKKFRKEKNLENLLVAANSSMIMEQKIWRELPEDLLEAIIARLPVATFFRFRSVCQKWNGLPTSHGFSQHCAEVSHAHPWFYMVTREHKRVMYDHSLKKWYHDSIPLLPERRVFYLASSVGGLICLVDLGPRKVFVCNPLTRSFEQLPIIPFQGFSRASVGMILNGKTARSGYKVMFLASNGDHDLYDSTERCWTRPGIMPPSIKLPLLLNFRSQTLSIGNSLYFLHSEPDGIISYDVVNGVWKQFIIPLPTHLTDSTLAECEGRIMLVGLVSRNAATCVCVWELQKMTLLWKEVDRMPNIWCLDFYGKLVKMTCLGNQGLLMLSLWSRQINHVITYDLSKREWQKAPACVIGTKRQWLLSGRTFHPCLMTLL